jgi:hypothetical protein
MYRLMKSEKPIPVHTTPGFVCFYRQTQVKRFHQFPSALRACGIANDGGTPRHYLLNDSDQEYYGGTWID